MTNITNPVSANTFVKCAYGRYYLHQTWCQTKNIQLFETPYLKVEPKPDLVDEMVDLICESVLSRSIILDEKNRVLCGKSLLQKHMTLFATEFPAIQIIGLKPIEKLALITAYNQFQ